MDHNLTHTEDQIMARFYLYIGISLLALFITMTFTSIYVIEGRVQVVNQLSTDIEKQASSASVIFVDRERAIQGRLRERIFRLKHAS